jgi:hypothetical protein
VVPSRLDIERFEADAIAAVPAPARAGRAQQLKRTRYPAALPPYSKLLVDSRDNLWVQASPTLARRDVLWVVVSPQEQHIASIRLPSALDVFEIGDDYVLGAYTDPADGVPEVRVYTLRRR